MYRNDHTFMYNAVYITLLVHSIDSSGFSLLLTRSIACKKKPACDSNVYIMMLNW